MFKNRLNIPLSRKIFLLVLSCIGVLSVLASLSFAIIMRSTNRLLYQTVADAMSDSAGKIVDRLTTLETFSATIVLDKSLQQKLADISENPVFAGQNQNAEIFNILESYQQQFYHNHVSYIILANDNLLSKPYMHTYIKQERKFPMEVYEDLLELAYGNYGRAVWITKYSDQYGLFLVREIRQIKDARLDTLGVIIINVDEEALLSDASHYSSQYGNPLYALFDHSKVVSNSNSLNDTDIRRLSEYAQAYGIITLSKENYFMVRNQIPQMGWDFYNLIPYHEIYHSLRVSQIIFFVPIFLSFFMITLLARYFIKGIMFHINTLVQKIKSFGENEGTISPEDMKINYSERTDEIGIIHQNFDEMAFRIHDLIYINYQNEILMKEAQIKALEAQINPHFLYNTLESINWRAKGAGEMEISQMAESLGYLLRSTLSSQGKMFSLSEEVEFINCYLMIQKMRFEEQLQTAITIDEQLLSMQVPKLVVQPLMENAIHYGLEETMDDCYIQVNIFTDEAVVYIDVRNTGSKFDLDLLHKLEEAVVKPSGFGIGLLNIEKRIKLTYGDSYGLQLYNEPGYAVARITLPHTEF